MNTELDNAAAATAEPASKIRMTRADALSVLAKIAQKKNTPLEEVVALQLAVRKISKRMFDRERWFKRKWGDGTYHTPQAAIDAVLTDPPMDVPPKLVFDPEPLSQNSQLDN